ncbi:unnamed protein product [Moneuplotes crassus]|uniref:Uncharacterized protein n=1 Tax=Euplotes crassus TaxID=5936 RepID=A0AAD2D7M2_EUPCR|nr:unnamed protein product [Moneuplotes crassus]
MDKKRSRKSIKKIILRPQTDKTKHKNRPDPHCNSLLCLKGRDATPNKLKEIRTNVSTMDSEIHKSIQTLKMRSSFTSGFWSTKHSKKYQDKTRNAHRANNNTNTKHKTLNNFHKLTNLTHGHSKSSKKNSLKEKCSKSQNKSRVIASSSLNEFKTIISEELISHEKNKVKDSNNPFFDLKVDSPLDDDSKSQVGSSSFSPRLPPKLAKCSSVFVKKKRSSLKLYKFKFGEKKVSKLKKNKKVFKPNKPLFSTIKLKNGVQYICRLHNHLTNQEIVDQVNYSENLRVKPNSFVVRKALKNPKISSKDVYDKVVYDFVRRKDLKTKQKQKPKNISKGARQSEIQLLNALLPKDKKKKYLNSTNNFDKNKENPTISHKELGESNYEDWFECKKHDLTYTAPIDYDLPVKNMKIRLLLKQLDGIIDRLNIEYANLDTEVEYLEELNNIVHSYNSSMSQICERDKKVDVQTTIFNGQEFVKKGITKNVSSKDKHRNKLDLTLKVIIEKRYLISTHIEKAMVLFDITKKKKVLAESEEDIKISHNIYDITKSIVKQMAEEFQFVEREMNNIVDDILESNMPFKPNPLLGWQEVENEHREPEVHEISAKKLASSLIFDFTRHLTQKIGLKNSRNGSNVSSLHSSPAKLRTKLPSSFTKLINKKTLRRLSKFQSNPMNKVINEAVIHRAIDETDCDLKFTSKENRYRKEREKILSSNTLILHYVAKSLSLLGRKIKQSIQNQKNKVNFFDEAVPMPISMRPNIIIENYELSNRDKTPGS